MAELKFETLEFFDEGNRIKVVLLKLFYFYLKKKELEEIAPFVIEKNKIVFEKIPQEKAEKKFSFLLEKAIKNLKNVMTGNPAIYLHQNSGIPLIGNVAFGIVYRNTSLIEVKPVTSCNLNCIFCSVGEGLKSKKTDFVIEKDYLMQELKKLISFVGEPVEIHIGVNGEPFLYGDLFVLIEDINNLEKVHTISLDTNGTLLTKEAIDKLAKFKKLCLNISLHALNQKTAQEMAGGVYNLNKILEMIKYAKGKVKVLLTPLLVPGYNDSEIEDLVKFAKENSLELGIQNFLFYKTGRNPVKPWHWPKFYDFLKKLEEKYKMKLVLSSTDFKIKYAKELPLPFHKDDIALAEIACPDRFPHSRIAVAKEKIVNDRNCCPNCCRSLNSKGLRSVPELRSFTRTISLPSCDLDLGKKVKVKIVRDKHNIFTGNVV